MYAEDYSEDNPVIKVNVTRQGGTEEYRININEVNPRYATEIEMFSLCNYADAKGIGTDSFKSVKQDWMKMVQLMMKDYIEAGLFKQSLDGKGLLGIFERYAR